MNAAEREQLRSVIGPRAEYYLQQFERIESVGGRWSTTWNWPAFFCSTAWFTYRRMSGYAVLNFFAPLAAMMLIGIASPAGPIPAIVLFIAYLALAFVVVPMYANALYNGWLKKQVACAPSPDQLPSPPGIGSGLSAAFLVLLPVGFFFVAQTAYVDYMPRSQVSEAISLMGHARTPIAEYHAEKRKWPEKVEQVTGNTSGKYTERIEITSGAGAASGTLTMTATMKAEKLSWAIAGKTVQMSTEDGKTWNCYRGAVNGVEDRYLPAACRP